MFYETEVSFDSESETSERRRGITPMEAARMQQMNMMAAAMAQQQQEEEAEAERRRRAAGVATTPDFVLNTPPLRFPPTARRTSYVQTRHPQIRGVRRFP